MPALRTPLLAVEFRSYCRPESVRSMRFCTGRLWLPLWSPAVMVPLCTLFLGAPTYMPREAASIMLGAGFFLGAPVCCELSTFSHHQTLQKTLPSTVECVPISASLSL